MAKTKQTKAELETKKSRIVAAVTTLTTFALFFFEAMLHYQIGRNGSISLTNFSLPSWGELFQIGAVVAFFSVLSGVTSSFLVSLVPHPK